jgi:hypothetical protein
MHQSVTSQANACTYCIAQVNACTYCMHCPMTSQANACSYCMGSVVLISSRIYLYSSYFALTKCIISIFIIYDLLPQTSIKGFVFVFVLIVGVPYHESHHAILGYLFVVNAPRSNSDCKIVVIRFVKINIGLKTI